VDVDDDESLSYKGDMVSSWRAVTSGIESREWGLRSCCCDVAIVERVVSIVDSVSSIVPGTYVNFKFVLRCRIVFDFPDPEYVDALLAKVLWSISVGERSLYLFQAHNP
jgi:hypothetical protein